MGFVEGLSHCDFCNKVNFSSFQAGELGGLVRIGINDIYLLKSRNKDFYFSLLIDSLGFVLREHK